MTGTRRANRESTISETPNARGYYDAFVWMGTKPDGSPDRRHRERKTLPALRKAVRELERKRDAGLAAKAGRPKTIRQMMDRHLDVVLPQRGRAPSTIIGYRSLLTHQVYPRWENQRIDRFMAEQLEDGLADMLASGLAPSTVRKVRAILSAAFEIEVQRGHVARNPCRLVEAPRLPQAARKNLTIEQGRAVIAAAAGSRNSAMWAVGLSCGFRQSERIALRYEYLSIDGPDGEPGEARIWHQLQRLPWRHGCADVTACAGRWHKRACPKRCPKVRPSGRRHLCVPAGAKGLCPASCLGHAAQCPERTGGGLAFREIKERRRKTVPLAWELVELLRVHRDVQAAGRELAANLWEEHGLVFCQENGRPIDQSADWREWRDLLKAAGVPHVGTHAARHTAASVGLEEGTPLAVVQELLGHRDIRVTRGYSTVSSALAAAGASRTARAFLAPTATKTATRAS